MGSPKNKLAKFAEFDAFENTFDYSHDTKGKWSEIFGNNHPIVVEFACGKGEYSIGLAKLNPHINYIGVDIKGNRLWKGAKMALEAGLQNVRFLRIQIDNAAQYFATGEVHEAWKIPQYLPGNHVAKLPVEYQNRQRFILRNGFGASGYGWFAS
jgi:tRNA (guanine-N7-)-methyltransferase